MTHPSRHRRSSKLRSWYVWHRWLGVCASLLVLVLAVTGILLNHTEALRLDARQVHSEALLTWYGIDGPAHLTSYAVGPKRLTQGGQRWFLDAKPLPGEFPPLRGAVRLQSLLVAATSDALWLLTEQGEVVERMDNRAGIPAGIRRIGTDADGHLLIDTDGGYWRGDRDLVQWQPVEQPAQVRWAAPEPVPDALRQEILQFYRGAGLPLERVLLDLHSGRIFGGWGVFLMDAAAVVLVMLACSGVWLWWRGRSRRRRQRSAP